MPRSHRYAIRAELMFLNILRFNMLPANAEGTAALTFNLKHLKIQIILASQLGSDFPHFLLMPVSHRLRLAVNFDEMHTVFVIAFSVGYFDFTANAEYP